MAASKDFYEILGVSRTATTEEIKKAFRRLAARHHPDRFPGAEKKAAEAEFKKISEAYEVLGDPEKRRQYDQFGSSGSAGAGYGPGFSGFSGAEGFDFTDIFESFFSGSAAGRRGGGRSAAARGADVEARVTVSFEDAVFGTLAEFKLPRTGACSHCGGSGGEPGAAIADCKTCHGTGEVTQTRQTMFGAMQHRAACPTCGGEGKTFEKKCGVCHGTGQERRTEKLKVKIPAGVDSGSVIRLPGQGEAGVRGGPAGDLFIHVAVQPHATLRRRGADILSDQSLHPAQAALGDEIEVATVHGRVKLKIPAGTQPGQTFRLVGYGAPKLNGKEKGDHLVTLAVAIPKKLSAREKELFAELAKEAGLKPGDGKKNWFGF